MEAILTRPTKYVFLRDTYSVCVDGLTVTVTNHTLNQIVRLDVSQMTLGMAKNINNPKEFVCELIADGLLN
ncbi:hypothetical protein AWH56_008825 [Anaerobacillus isosaccharinicus]|uniref:Uncharacterized protein n=1 Tax=Anaerobacillus isosaccharinicus TaxID=1532552 RepID=A0A1S2L123_9BACI|nr:hypothetical protein [Anaerobacillus isosaccharinicus]MBA5588924.1 hypothetical protein [Anaerobacillus isosaccharinicus]QOY37665.1 hypothetical protein AWH56_008825 [Anaerobacillus isosaccharinicus]